MNLLARPESRLRKAHKLNRRLVAPGTELHTYSSLLRVQYQRCHDARRAGGEGTARKVHRITGSGFMRRAGVQPLAVHAALQFARDEYVCMNVSTSIAGPYHADALTEESRVSIRPRRRSAADV
jgi:hypothetical protein